MIIAAIFMGFCIFMLLNQLGNDFIEENILKERIRRLSGEIVISSPNKISEVIKMQSKKQKGSISGLFSFPVMPDGKLIVMGFLLAGGAAFLIFTKMTAPIFPKMVFTGILGLIILQIVKIKAKKARLEKIRKELPGTLELLVICLQAGMGINSAFLRVANEMENSILGGELKYTFNEVNAGIPMEDALKNFAKRCDIAELSAVASAVIQAQKMGTAIATTFKVQAESIREQYRMKAKEQIMKIPVKILFPLIFFIFPALFIVILAPPILGLVKQVSPP